MGILTSIEAITDNQKKFYQTLFSNYNNHVEVRLIDNMGQVKRIFLTYKELLNYPTPANVNVYVGIYERKHKGSGKISNCTMTNAIYLDFDGGITLDEIYLRVDMMKLPQPSMIVHSGHGYHVYWLLDKPRGHELKPIIKSLQEKLNADPNATDIARVLRVPDTMNVKDEHVACRLIELNDNKATVKEFENILGVKAHIEHIEHTGAINELLNVKFNGLHNMANGVTKGERNFCTGRIVQTLKRLNYTKKEVTDIVFKWNALNSPKKTTRELKKEINVFYHDERYKYAGKEFSDERLQELNNRFIDDETKFFKGIETSNHNYDNELLQPKKFQKVRGLTFAILSIIKLAESEGIRREQIADLCKRHVKDKGITFTLRLLEQMKYIKSVKRNNVNHYVFTEKANYKRGYTTVSKSLHRSFIHGELKEHEYKMMILLESYAYDDKSEIYPSNHTLSYRMGRTDRNIRQILKQLQHHQFIKIEYKHGRRYIRFIYR